MNDLPNLPEGTAIGATPNDLTIQWLPRPDFSQDISDCGRIRFGGSA
jgi:hypothetical protein